MHLKTGDRKEAREKRVFLSRRKKMNTLFEEAKKYIPGGVNSPVRAFKAVGGEPVFMEKGKGSKIYDINGREYIDYVLSWGPLILGHAHPQIVGKIKKVLDKGTSFGSPTPGETELAKLIVRAVPGIEKIRLVNSGTEATMSAIRLARGYTGRDKIVKFEGCYHGHADYLLVKAGSGATTLGFPDSGGVPRDFTQNTILVPYNDICAVHKVIKEHHPEIAAVIIEPVAGNMGVVLPEDDFLQKLREITAEYGILLIFDEVITGFRLSYGGAQKYFDIIPDLTCLGKIIGGGFPVGAYGGRKEIMDYLSPLGPVYQAGTLSGNPIAVWAGICTLKLLSQPGVYEKLEEKTKNLVGSLQENARKLGVNIYINQIGSMFTLFFSPHRVYDYQSAKKSDEKKFAQYFQGMLRKGVYLPCSQYETNFLSLVHTQEDIEKTLKANYESLRALK
ncbi:glutamate-1-semialdehyde 2,1-aminomutase [Candidatus Aerophobetes bacterium]|nr:glutamate-1-semialdehyde 2,1-aminomutase [Candidatus Aerophobetes bacterium]